MQPSPSGSSGPDRRKKQADRVAEDLAVDLLDDEAHVPGPDIVLARRLASAGISGVLVALAAIAALHLVMPSRSLDPLSRTISEYALLPNGWVFSWGVVVLAASSALILAAMLVREMVPWRSFSALFMSLWCLGLLGLVVFPKQGFNSNPSMAGRVHWTWTLIAFFSLPIGTCLMCWQHRVVAGRWPRWAVRLSLVAGGWFVVLTGQTVLSAVTPIQAWRVVGLVERVLSATEMAVVVVLGLWVLHDCRPPAVFNSRRDP